MTIIQVPEVYSGKSLGIHIYMCVLSCFSRVWLCNAMDRSPPGSSVHGILQAKIKNIGVGCRALLQGIFSTQGWNWCLFCLLHWQVGVFFYFLFFFTTSATWEAHTHAYLYVNDITWHKRATYTYYIVICIYIYIHMYDHIHMVTLHNYILQH